MNTLYDIITEKLQLKLKISNKTKKIIQKCIYKELEKNNTTGRFYHDDYWQGVDFVRKDVEEGLYQAFRKTNLEFDFSIYADNGGYQKSNDGMSQWKAYKVEIFYKKQKSEPIMVGTLNCHAAGTIEDPFKSYDMSFVLSV
jgi:hypothetical protein